MQPNSIPAIYFEAVQGASAVEAGIKLLPMLIATVVGSLLCGAGISIIGYYNPFYLVEAVLLTVGAGMITTFATDTPFGRWFGFLVLFGLGVGGCFSVGSLVIQNTLPQELVPQGTAVVQFCQSLGGTLFISIAQAAFQNGLINALHDTEPALNPYIFINTGASQIYEVLEAMGKASEFETVLEAYMVGVKDTFYIAVATGGCAFVVAACLQWKKLRKNRIEEDSEKDDETASARPVNEV
jgi:MFS family permease